MEVIIVLRCVPGNKTELLGVFASLERAMAAANEEKKTTRASYRIIRAELGITNRPDAPASETLV